MHGQGRETVYESVWTIGFYLEFSTNKLAAIERVMEIKVMEKLLVLLDDVATDMSRPLLRIFGHLSFASASQINRFFTPYFAGRIIEFLYSKVSSNRFDACWILSNLLITSAEIYDTFFQPRVVERIFEIILEEKHVGVAIEAAYVLNSLLSSATAESMEQLIVHYRVINVLMLSLERRTSQDFLIRVLDCLEAALDFSSRFAMLSGDANPVASLVINNQHFQNLENLQYVESEQIYTRVNSLMQAHLEQYLRTD